ncbi:MAG: hypothetical protein ACMXYC_00035 [Candidatus Woesearchaeota archaeon]
MQYNTLEELVNCADAFEQVGTKQDSDVLGIHYYTVPQAFMQEIFNLAPPYGVMRAMLSPDDECVKGHPREEHPYVIGVSQDIDQKLQPYFALAEYKIFMEYGIEHPDRTYEAEKEMLGIVPQELLPLYIQTKCAMYDYIVKHATPNPKDWGFNEQDIATIQKASALLKKHENS